MAQMPHASLALKGFFASHRQVCHKFPCELTIKIHFLFYRQWLQWVPIACISGILMPSQEGHTKTSNRRILSSCSTSKSKVLRWQCPRKGPNWGCQKRNLAVSCSSTKHRTQLMTITSGSSAHFRGLATQAFFEDVLQKTCRLSTKLLIDSQRVCSWHLYASNNLSVHPPGPTVGSHQVDREECQGLLLSLACLPLPLVLALFAESAASMDTKTDRQREREGGTSAAGRTAKYASEATLHKERS